MCFFTVTNDTTPQKPSSPVQYSIFAWIKCNFGSGRVHFSLVHPIDPISNAQKRMIQ